MFDDRMSVGFVLSLYAPPWGLLLSPDPTVAVIFVNYWNNLLLLRFLQ